MNTSNGTRQNWQRLKIDPETKLQKCANKSRSKKIILPQEYINSPDSPAFIRQISDLFREEKAAVENVIFSLAVKLLETKGILQLPHVRKLLDETAYTICPAVLELTLPGGEKDLLGLIYQCLQSEGKKNTAGSYYTPPALVQTMLADKEFSRGKSFCDPCCGSGAFLLEAPVEDPEQLWGCDKDPLAVFIAKINLLCKYKELRFSPQIFCADYLTGSPHSLKNGKFFAQKFDIIATNPPWGAEKNRGKESFALFLEKAVEQTKEGGKVAFLLPESVLRIKAHTQLRQFILQNSLEKIVLHSSTFTGVMTSCVEISLRKAPPAETFELQKDEKKETVQISHIRNNKDNAFVFILPQAREILTYVQSQKNHFLQSGQFALGIVTGDNKNKITDICQKDMEPVCTGKDIRPYVLKKPTKYLRYDRQEFQQTAPEKYYRASEKLVYKFISDKLVFAYDNTGTLFLNSANILIPDIPGMSIKTVLAFLNSNFLRFYYSVMFSDIKILKGNLMQLPFPEITQEENAEIETLTDCILKDGQEADEKLQQLIYRSYNLSKKQIQFIEGHIF